MIERGQVWQLGRHRLLCGDATSKEDVEKLMNGEKANLMLTDPPYGVNIVNVKSGGGLEEREVLDAERDYRLKRHQSEFGLVGVQGAAPPDSMSLL